MELKNAWMNRLSVLHLGIKYWPYSDQVINHQSLQGIRGGGMNKYCDLLINHLPQDVNTIIICQKLKGQKRFEKRGNIQIYRVPAFGNRANRQIITNLISFFISWKIFYKEKIDIIHGHMQPGIFVAYFLGKLFRKPVVATPYSFTTIELNFLYNKITKYIESTYYKKVDILVFESEENRNKALTLRNLVFPNSVIIHTGITVPEMIMRSGKREIYNMLYIGRLVKIKALENLILSFMHYDINTLKKIHLNIIGEGELHEKLQNLIIENGLSSSITLHGYLEDCTQISQNSDIFILPSYQEGLSISLLEAMSYGMACVVNNFGVPFKKGSVYEMTGNDPKTIAKSITDIIENTNLFNQLRENARKEIIENYSVHKFAQKYYQIYKKLMR
jgi:glycosyltransferase involved in cell wall biosynthesis